MYRGERTWRTSRRKRSRYVVVGRSFFQPTTCRNASLTLNPNNSGDNRYDYYEFIIFFTLLTACGEKEEDTAVVTDTADTEETDTEDTSDTEETDTEETDTEDILLIQKNQILLMLMGRFY